MEVSILNQFKMNKENARRKNEINLSPFTVRLPR
uniref:Uncharacterized protein n=1 Tax=Rhizophora mucronata TaxID=61149 RepID=A0A2P2IUF1_RHIMU